MRKHWNRDMMKTFGSVSITSHRSSDSVSSEGATDELWSPEPSSGYCSADDEHPSYDLRTPTTTPGRSLSESSSGISSRSLLSLSLSEALSLTFCESPPPSPPPPPPPPPPPDDVPPFQDLVDSRFPGSSNDFESSSLSSAVPTTSNDEFPRIISSGSDVYSFLGRLEPCGKRCSSFTSGKRCSSFTRNRGVEPQTVSTKADHILPSDDIQTDLSSIETNLAQDPSEDSRSHKKIRLQLISCSEENNDLSNEIGRQMTAWSSRSCSTNTRENTIIDEVRKEQCEVPDALVSLQFDGSAIEEENVADDDMMYLVTSDGDLNIAEAQRSPYKKTVCTTPSHRPLSGPRIEHRRNFDASYPEHSMGLSDKEDLHRRSPDVFGGESCATDCYESPHFAVNTSSTSSTTPTSSSTSIGSTTTTSVNPTTSPGSTTCTAPTVSTCVNNSVDLKAFRIAVGLFHSYAAVKETSSDSSRHSNPTNNPSCSSQSQDLRFIDHDTVADLSHDPILPNAQTTLQGHSQDPLHDGSVSTTNEELLQVTIEYCDVREESSRSGNTSSLSVDNMPRIASSKRSRPSSSYRQSSKRRRRHSSPALAELADHGYALKAACCPASLHRSSTSPCVVTVEEDESISNADVSSVLAKLLLTDERLFPNEGSAGFIARRSCSSGSAENTVTSLESSGGQGLSGSLLERLLTGQMDRDEIQRSEERVIRDRVEARPDSNDDVVDEDVDLQLQDFDPGSLELENLEELWKNYGDLLGKFLA